MLSLLTKVELPCVYVVVSQNTYPKKRQQPYMFGNAALRMFQVWINKTRLQYILYAYIPDISQDVHL